MGPWSDLYAVGQINDLLDHQPKPSSSTNPRSAQCRSADANRLGGRSQASNRRFCLTAPEEWLDEHIEQISNITIPKSRQEQQFQSAPPDVQIPWRQFAVSDFPAAYPEDISHIQRVFFPLYQDPPLIGRSQILEQLWQSAHQTCLTQKAQVVLMIGPKGVGKTRIMANIARRLERAGLMSRLLLRYHSVPSEDDGYHGHDGEILSPIESDASAF